MPSFFLGHRFYGIPSAGYEPSHDEAQLPTRPRYGPLESRSSSTLEPVSTFQPTAGTNGTAVRLFLFLSPFSKYFLKYAPDGKISENGPRA
jgi:hypothetical protein